MAEARSRFISALSPVRRASNSKLSPPLPERLQELLGYNIYGTLLGNVDGRHPRKYLGD